MIESSGTRSSSAAIWARTVFCPAPISSHSDPADHVAVAEDRDLRHARIGAAGLAGPLEAGADADAAFLGRAGRLFGRRLRRAAATFVQGPAERLGGRCDALADRRVAERAVRAGRVAGPGEVLPAQLERIQPERRRDLLGVPLIGDVRVGDVEAAHRTRGRLVGVDDPAVEGVIRDVVRPAAVDRDLVDPAAAEDVVRPGVLDGLDLPPDDRAVLLDGRLEVELRVGLVLAGREHLLLRGSGPT